MLCALHSASGASGSYHNLGWDLYVNTPCGNLLCNDDTIAPRTRPATEARYE